MTIIQALGWYFPDSIGGTEVYVQGLSGRLMAAGHEVLIVAPAAGAECEREYEHLGLRVYRYPIPASPSREECQGLVPVRGAEIFRRLVERLQPEVIHFHTFVTGMGARELEAARATGARVVVTSHTSSLGYLCQRGTMMRWGSHLCDGVCRPSKCAACALQNRGMPRAGALAIGSIPPLLGRLARSFPGSFATALSMSDLIERNRRTQLRVMAATERFVVLTEWGRRALEANGAPSEKVVVNRLGVSQTEWPCKLGPDSSPTRRPITVGYLGRFEPVKGVLDFARAIAALPADVEIECEFRGPVRTTDEKFVYDQAQALLKSRKRVRFAPAVEPAESMRILASYDVLCCPSICLEGGPTVAIEAHAVGTPVIGSRIGGLAELVEDGVNGELVPPGDWKALSECLLRIAEDPRSTVDRWRRSLPTVRTMDQIAADYLTMYGAPRDRA